MPPVLQPVSRKEPPRLSQAWLRISSRQRSTMPTCTQRVQQGGKLSPGNPARRLAACAGPKGRPLSHPTCEATTGALLPPFHRGAALRGSGARGGPLPTRAPFASGPPSAQALPRRGRTRHLRPGPAPPAAWRRGPGAGAAPRSEGPSPAADPLPCRTGNRAGRREGWGLTEPRLRPSSPASAALQPGPSPLP